MNQKTIRWYFNCRKWMPKREEFLFVLRCIQKDEQERIMKFVYRNDLKHALIGRLLLRKCINLCLNIPYSSIKLGRSDKGRPILEEIKDCQFDFNISHHGDYCILAADDYAKVGTDVVKLQLSNVKYIPEYFQRMRKIFCQAEWKFIEGDDNSLNYQKQLARFLRLWCLKESFVKAEGVGIGFELSRIKFECDPSLTITESQIITNTNVYVDEELLEDWKFEETLLDQSHCAAVALYPRVKSEQKENCNNPPSFQLLSFDQLLEKIEPFNQVDESLWILYLSKSERM